MSTNNPTMNAVTGAFGYTGKYITRQLLAKGEKVITITGHPEQSNEFENHVKAFPYHFDKPEMLAASLEGVKTLYNTYWVRFNHGKVSYENAVANTLKLINAAKSAGVERIVHVSITNPSPESDLPYFKGKGILESAIQQSGISYGIIRPTVIFGLEDILINNIAYLLRKYPVFVIPGNGNYRLQPIYVEDMANLCVKAGNTHENIILDAIGPKIFTFTQLVHLIADKIDSKAKIIHLPVFWAYSLSQVIGLLERDIVLTREEIRGLSSDLLISKDPPTGTTTLESWLEYNAANVGKQYSSELERHFR